MYQVDNAISIKLLINVNETFFSIFCHSFPIFIATFSIVRMCINYRKTLRNCNWSARPSLAPHPPRSFTSKARKLTNNILVGFSWCTLSHEIRHIFMWNVNVDDDDGRCVSEHKAKKRLMFVAHTYRIDGVKARKKTFFHAEPSYQQKLLIWSIAIKYIYFFSFCKEKENELCVCVAIK
jgi:hypothetical protein